MGKTLDASVRILRADGGKRGPKEDMRVSISRNVLVMGIDLWGHFLGPKVPQSLGITDTDLALPLANRETSRKLPHVP